jgi:uncharacterized protein
MYDTAAQPQVPRVDLGPERYLNLPPAACAGCWAATISPAVHNSEGRMIEKVREIVQSQCEENDWKYHILLVTKYAKLLARKLNVDENIAELGALLHDIGRIAVRGGDPDHEIKGVPIAEEILKEQGYSPDVIEEVKHCVESHRASKGVSPRTIIARIVADADAMAHFDAVPALIQLALQLENNDLEKAVQWVHEKIERDWKRKLTLPEAREMMEEKYKAIRLVLGSMVEDGNLS